MTTAVATTNPILKDQWMVRVLVDKYTGRVWVRDNGFGRFYLTGYDAMGCYVWAPCDRIGNPIL